MDRVPFERNQIKVAHIITRLDLGGAQQNTLYTVRYLDKERFTPLLISGVGGVLDKEVMGDCKKYRTYFVKELINRIDAWKHLRALLEMISILKKEKPLIVHTHCPVAGVLGRWAAYFAGVPVVIHTFHGFGFNDYQCWIVRNFYIFLEKMTAKITHKFIMVSKENLKRAHIYRIGTPDKHTIVHSGIKIKDFAKPNQEEIERVKKDFGVSENETVVGMIAPLKPGKAPEDFIELAKTISRINPKTKFILVGDGILRKKLEQLIYKLSLNGKVILAGWRRDISTILHIFDIVVLTTLHEGLPRVIIEAMAAGKPVVSTSVGGIKDIIVHRRNGLLVEPHDIQSMAQYVLELVKDKELALRLGEEGKRSLGEEFDIDKMVIRIGSVYNAWTYI